MPINQESKKIQYFIYLKPTLFLWATQKVRKKLFAIFKNLLKSTLNMFAYYGEPKNAPKKSISTFFWVLSSLFK
jgi:hypothetical protein